MSAITPLLEILAADGASAGLAEFDACGDLTRLIPELEAGRGFVQPELHYYDVLSHNLAAVAAVDAAMGEGEDGAELRTIADWIDWPDAFAREVGGIEIRTLIRLSCLVHDVAKPATAVFLEGRLRFPRHGPTGSEMMRERLPQLGLDEAAVDFVARMIRQHLRPIELIRNWPATEHAVRRFVRDVDGHVLPLMLVNLADGMATRGPRYTRESFRRHSGFLSYVVARAVAVSEKAVEWLINGEDLIEIFDRPSGRLLGAVLTSVRQAQADGAIANRDEALAMARRELAALQASLAEAGPAA